MSIINSKDQQKNIFIQFPETLQHINVGNIFFPPFTIPRYLARCWEERQNRDVDTASEAAASKKKDQDPKDPFTILIFFCLRTYPILLSLLLLIGNDCQQKKVVLNVSLVHSFPASLAPHSALNPVPARSKKKRNIKKVFIYKRYPWYK